MKKHKCKKLLLDKKKIKLMVSEEKYLIWMNEFFELNKLKQDICTLSQRELTIVWSSVLHGRLGMHVRNYMRGKHKVIDIDFPNYGDFEDYSWELMLKLVDKWKSEFKLK